MLGSFQQYNIFILFIYYSIYYSICIDIFLTVKNKYKLKTLKKKHYYIIQPLVLSIMNIGSPYLVVGIGFIIFVAVNGSIVVGKCCINCNIYQLQLLNNSCNPHVL